MARARNIKPSFFKNEVLGAADPLVGLLFISLWTLADRDGRLEDRPARIKAETFPYREKLDINRYLTELERLGFIQRYQVDNNRYIHVVNFAKHQSPHKTEKPSEIPPYTDSCALTDAQPLNNGTVHVKESLIPDSSNTDSLIPDSRVRASSDASPRLNGKKFQKPSIPEIREYCESIGATIKPAVFYNHYETVGWKVGKNPMVDWKVAVRGWNGRQQ